MKLAVALCALSFLGSANAVLIWDDNCWIKVNTIVGYSQIECQDKALTGFTPGIDLVTPSAKTDLISIKIYKNALSGLMPTQIGELTKLKAYVDYRNQISGFLPSQIGLVTTFTELNLYKNKVSGTIPTEAGGHYTIGGDESGKINWNNFVIMNNKFSGCIPQELTVCSDDLPNNSVNGYCSMSTQGSPGIDGNCATDAPTTAPTEPIVCERMKHGEFHYRQSRCPVAGRSYFQQRKVIKFLQNNPNPCGNTNPWMWVSHCGKKNVGCDCMTQVKKGKKRVKVRGHWAVKRNAKKSRGFMKRCFSEQTKKHMNIGECAP